MGDYTDDVLMNMAQEYSKLEDDEDIVVLKLFSETAKEVIESSVGAFRPEKARHRLLFCMLIQNMNDDRSLLEEEKKTKLSNIAHTIILQLQLEEYDDGSETGETK